MCGLFSIISKRKSGFSEKEIKIFTEGLFCDTLRGKDSTGIYSISNEGNAYLLKDNTPGDEFISHKEYKDFIFDSYRNSKILVGHNRAATLGQKTDKNAHPFISGNTICVHNGTIYNHVSLANTETDSEAITIALNNKKHTEVLSNISGAFALIWYNAKEKKLYISRNEERPLWIIDHKDFDLIGSEPKMLEWLLHRNLNLDIEAKYFKPHNIYIWDLDKIEEGYNNVIQFEKKKYLPTIQTTRHKGLDTSTIGTKQEAFPGLNFFTPIIVNTTRFVIIDSKIDIYGTNEKFPNIIFKASNFNKTKEQLSLIQSKSQLILRPYTKTTTPNELLCAVDETASIVEDISGNLHIIPHNTKCTKCNTSINYGKIWTRKRQDNSYKTILCSTCVSTNPNLK